MPPIICFAVKGGGPVFPGAAALSFFPFAAGTFASDFPPFDVVLDLEPFAELSGWTFAFAVVLAVGADDFFGGISIVA